MERLTDSEKYKIQAKLFEFCKSETKISELHSERDAENIKEIAPLLSVSKLAIYEYSRLIDEENEKPTSFAIYYDDGNAGSRYSMYREYLGDYSVIRVVAYFTEGVDVSDEISDYAESLCKSLFYIKSRARLTEKFLAAAYYDKTFKIPNLEYGQRVIRKNIEQGEISRYASVFFNIKGLSDINSYIGRPAADKALLNYLNEIRALLSESEVLFRLGGDNFGGLILKDNINPFIRIIKGIPVKYGNNEREIIKISAACGICIIDGNTISSLNQVLDAAHSSMNIAKYQKHVPVLFYDESTIRMLEHTKRIEAGFDDTIKNGEYTAYYQPKVSLENASLIGAEALCRWMKNGTVIPPDSFIPVLERSNRICTLDFYILRCVCKDLRRWIDEGLRVVKVSVNFSRNNLSNPELVNDILETIDEFRVPHNLIIIEFTETTTVSDYNRLKEVVFKLRENEIETSVDDFGVGYSSLSLISQVPFNELKIDKTFIDHITDISQRNIIMIRHVINMAGEMRMHCIAEGVETDDQIEALREFGCDIIQGYYFDKPLEKSDFRSRLKNPDYSHSK